MPSLLRIRPFTLIICLLAFTPFASAQTPFVTNAPTVGSKAISGTGKPGATIYVCVDNEFPTLVQDCAPGGAGVAHQAGTTAAVHVLANNTFSATLKNQLASGDYVYFTQVDGAAHVQSVPVSAAVAAADADAPAPHEREHTDFVGGTILSANGSNYSQGDIFLALNYDRELYRPGFYSGPTRHPGLNFFFQARLTSIPVNASQTVTTTPNSSGGSGGTSTSTTATSVASFLAAQKTAQFGGGGYIPILFASSPSAKTLGDRQSTFYFGPIAKFGYSTPSGSPGGSSSTPSSTGTTTTTTTVLGTSTPDNGQLYNYWLAGFRIATADLEKGSIHTRHYFDIGIGKYSNLQSLICRPEKNPTNPTCLTASVNSSTTPPTTTYAPPIDTSMESKATLFRLAFEGYLEVAAPKSSTSGFILGMSANTGPSILSRRAHLDTNNRAVEDISFLVAYKFDISNLVNSLTQYFPK